jgi:hypothetical protein
MAIDDGSEDAGQVAVWLDLVEFAGFDQRHENGPVLCTCVVTCEERILSLQRDCVNGGAILGHLCPFI